MLFSIPDRANDFDQLAPYYDRLKNWTLGRAMKKSEAAHLNQITEGSKVLVLGGGAGAIIDLLFKELSKIHLTYVEPSQAMLTLAKSRTAGKQYDAQITFLQETFEKFDSDESYDVVIAHYFLDVFSSEHLESTLKKISALMLKEGKLIVADFQINDFWFHKLWQRVLSKLMHTFFLYTTNLESHSLKDIHDFVQKAGFNLENEKEYLGRFIFSRLYRMVDSSPL